MYRLATLAFLGTLLLNAYGAPAPELTPTINIGEIETSVVRTFAVGLTQTAFAHPTDTPNPTSTISPTSTPTLGTSSAPAGNGRIPTATCYGLTFIKDVTIPDNTIMALGQSFTKTWLAKNSGTCAWEAGSKFAFVSGDAMGGVTLVLDNAVNPGTEKELSIAMKAPSKTGQVRGTWRMSTAGGIFFGDEMFVLINLRNVTPSVTRTATATTRTATATTRTATATLSSSTPTSTASSTATATSTATVPIAVDTPTPTPTQTEAPTPTPTT